MLEVPEPGEDHCHVVGIAKVNGVLIFYGAPWLNHSLNPLFVRNFHAVGEGEERIGSHGRAF